MLTLVPNTQTGTLTDHQQGTDDTLSGIDDASNVLFRDAFAMDDHALGGNDMLTGGASNRTDVTNTLYGDANSMYDHAQGGNNALTGGSPGPHFIPGFGGSVSNTLYGDAGDMHDNARGGNDLLIGGRGSDVHSFDVTNTLAGDAGSMYDNTEGGNNTLIGGALAVQPLSRDARSHPCNAPRRNNNPHRRADAR